MFWNKTSRSLRTKLLDYLECGLSKSYSTSSNMLGIDLWRGRRCCSCNLQLPPLSHRQSERAKTPDRDILSRPTTLPLLTPPSIAITTYQDSSQYPKSERLLILQPPHYIHTKYFVSKCKVYGSCGRSSKAKLKMKISYRF
uniref:Uncharacterized protein n=1 Tax=Chelonoidis abingdonii TaxID=106734 RepID=A0A8C0G8P4_CHEAB